MRRGFTLSAIIMLIVMGVGTTAADVADIERALVLSTGLGANDLGNMAWTGTQLVVEGDGTINILSGTGDMYADWMSLRNEDGFGRGGISALWASGDTIITAWNYYADYDGSLAPHGDGLSLSFDGGMTWQRIGILDLFPDRSYLATPNRYTTIWDISVSDDIIWCSTTAGYLLKSPDWGETWENILPYIPEIHDSPDIEFNFADPNHHGQCVDAYGDTIWVGTFLGMNLSVDGGETWTNFSWPQDTNAETHDELMPGNFPVAVEHTVVDGVTHVWVASHDYLHTGEIGMCHTADYGDTWEFRPFLEYRERPWNIAFGSAASSVLPASVVCVATSAGLMKTDDFGDTWEFLDIRESDLTTWDMIDGVSSVMTVGDTLWVTSTDGIARSLDGGESWRIFKGIHRVRTIDTGSRDIGISSEYDYLNDSVTTYPFPNPFSPRRGTSDYRRTRIQYALEYDASVTIRVYSYAGMMIRELLRDAPRIGGRDYQEPWDGRDKNGEIVPNGVYFYTIETSKGDTARDKIMVLD